MKYKVTVVETVSEEFEIEAETADAAIVKAEKMYKNCDLVLEPGSLIDVEFEVLQ